jgi:hypothetical protein
MRCQCLRWEYGSVRIGVAVDWSHVQGVGARDILGFSGWRVKRQCVTSRGSFTQWHILKEQG